MKSNRKELLQITFLCFITHTFFKILYTLYGVLLSELIGFNKYTISIKGNIMGCVPNNWMKVTVVFSMIFYTIFTIYLSFFLVKKGMQTSNRIKILVGSLFLYPLVDHVKKFIYYKIIDPFFILKNRTNLEKMKLPFFGDLYNLGVFHIIESLFYLCLLTFGIWYLWRNVWDKNLKIRFLQIGIISMIVGIYFFYSLVKIYKLFI